MSIKLGYFFHYFTLYLRPISKDLDSLELKSDLYLTKRKPSV